MNTVMSTLYGEGFFIHWTKAEKIGKLWLLFLQKYALCARLVYRLGRSRFALVPKLHMLHHGCMRLLREAEQAKKNGTRWTVNPLGESVQQQEDFIGKPSRLSRRVSAKQIHARVCKRSLISTMQCLKEADEDKRGLFFLRNVRWDGNKRLPVNLATCGLGLQDRLSTWPRVPSNETIVQL